MSNQVCQQLQQREEIVYENVGPCSGISGPPPAAAAPTTTASARVTTTTNNDKSSSVKPKSTRESCDGIPPDVIVGVLERMVYELEVSRGEGSMSRLSVAREETTTTAAAAGGSATGGAGVVDMIDVIRHVFPIVVDVQVETLANCFSDEEFLRGGHCDFTPPPATVDGLVTFLSLASLVETSSTTPPATSSSIRSLRSRIRGIYLPPYHNTPPPTQ